jgi:hypothetical protein
MHGEFPLERPLLLNAPDPEREAAWEWLVARCSHPASRCGLLLRRTRAFCRHHGLKILCRSLAQFEPTALKRYSGAQPAWG